jgi:hypothetical protein
MVTFVRSWAWTLEGYGKYGDPETEGRRLLSTLYREFPFLRIVSYRIVAALLASFFFFGLAVKREVGQSGSTSHASPNDFSPFQKRLHQQTYECSVNRVECF